MLRYGDTKRCRVSNPLSSVELIMTVDVIVVGARVSGAATETQIGRAHV